MGGENPLGQEELHGLAAVPDRPLPVLGRLTTGDVLELVRGKPGVAEPNARTFRSLENEMNFIFSFYFLLYAFDLVVDLIM